MEEQKKECSLPQARSRKLYIGVRRRTALPFLGKYFEVLTRGVDGVAVMRWSVKSRAGASHDACRGSHVSHLLNHLKQYFERVNLFTSSNLIFPGATCYDGVGQIVFGTLSFTSETMFSAWVGKELFVKIHSWCKKRSSRLQGHSWLLKLGHYQRLFWQPRLKSTAAVNLHDPCPKFCSIVFRVVIGANWKNQKMSRPWMFYK